MEPLEERVLLSANGWETLKPDGMQAYEYTSSAAISPGTTYTFTFEVGETADLALAVTMPTSLNGSATLRRTGNTSSIGTFPVNAGVTNFFSTYVINDEMVAGTYTLQVTTTGLGTRGTVTLDVLANGVWETEINSTGVNNTLATAQSISDKEFITITPATDRAAMSRVVVVGKVDAGKAADWYAFTAQANQRLDIQLVAPGCENLTLELYNASGTLLTKGTSSEGFQSAIDSYLAGTTSATLYVKVVGSVTTGTIGTGTTADANGRYTLAIYRNASFEIENNDALPDGQSVAGGTLDSETTGFGHVNGYTATDVTESVLTSTSSAFGKAIAVDGNRMAVTTNDSSTGGRKLSIYEYDGVRWVLKTSISTDIGTAARYGVSVSFSGNYILVGASSGTNSASVQTGCAFIYQYVGGVLTQVGKFAPTDLAASDAFGSSVSIYGDTAVVSAPNATVNGVKSGAVYVYKFNGTGWNQEAKIAGGANGAASASTTSVAEKGLFGTSVAYDGKYLAVGASADVNAENQKTGAVYIYTRTSAGWTQISRLVPTNLSETAYKQMSFGETVSLADGILAVGAPDYHDSGSNRGSVFAFRLATVTGSGVSTRAAWTQQAILTPSSTITAVTQDFGISVSVEGGKILVGATSYVKFGSLYSSGAAFLYEYAASGKDTSAVMQWRSAGMFTPATVGETMNFGGNVVLANGRACVAATLGGSVHTFDHLPDYDTWTVNVSTASARVNVALYVLGTANSLGTGALTAPVVEIYDPAGKLLRTIVAVEGSKSLSNFFTSTTAGTYTIIVRAAAGTSCQYALDVANYNGKAFGSLTPLSVEGVSPAAGTVISSKPGTVTVRFSQQILASSLTTSTASILQKSGSTITLTGGTLIDGNTIQWTVPTAATLLEGTLTVSLQGVKDIWGQTISTTTGVNSYTFLYDNTPPKVTTFSQENLPATTYPAFAKITFSEAMAENFNEYNLVLTGSNTGTHKVIPVYDAATNTLVLCTAKALVDDYYTLTLKSGFDGLRDQAGLALAGDGTTAGTNYVKQFFIDSDGQQQLPTPLTAVGISGAMTWSASAKASLSSFADNDLFTLTCKAGQTISVEVLGEVAGMRPVITIYKLGGSASNPLATSINAGTSTAVTTAFTIPSDGDYVIHVSSEATGLAGIYTVHAVINSALETPADNNTSAAAQTISTAFWTATGTVRQGSVIGSLSSATDVDYYAFQLGAGYQASFTLTSEYSDAVFEIYSGATLIARSAPESDGSRQTVLQLKNTGALSATYQVKVYNPDASTLAVKNYVSEYQLLITLNAMLESQKNDTLSTGLDISTLPSVIGSVTGPEINSTTHTAAISVSALGTSSLTSTQMASLGSSAAVSGNWAVVGGSDYAAVYQLSDGAWHFYQLLTPSVGVGNELLAASVAISGNTLVLGSTGSYQQLKTGQGPVRTGAVYIYQLNGTQWKLEQAFTPQDAQYADLFGHAVALEGDTLAVSAVKGNESDGGNSDTGAVYILQRTASGWQQTAKITASDASQTEYFGFSLALESNTLIVGAINDYNKNTGKAYVFRNIDGHWLQTQTLQDSISTLTSGALFGANVQISGQWLAVSAPSQTVSGKAYAGAVYMFRYNTTTDAWVYYSTLTAHQTAENAYWGTQLVLDGTSLFVASAPAGTLPSATVECFMQETYTPGSYGVWVSQWANTVTNSGSILLAGDATRMITLYPQRSATAVKVESWTNFQDLDHYTFTATTSTSVSMSITAIINGSTMATGTRPLVEVFTATETVASNASSNYGNMLTFSVKAGTTYYVRVTSRLGQTCNYALNLSGFTAASLSPTVDATTPANAAAVPSIADNGVTVHFSQSVNLSTVKMNFANVKATVGANTSACTGYEVIDGKTIRFLFANANFSTDAAVSVTLPGAQLKDVNGNNFPQATFSFTIDTRAPYLDYAVLGAGSIISHTSTTSATTLSLVFSEKLNAQVIKASDFILTGTVSGQQNVASVSFSADGKQATLNFGVLPQDHYTLTLNPAGSGLPDMAGNATTPFTVDFSVVYRATVTLENFEKIVMPGSLAYEKKDAGYLTPTGSSGYEKTYSLTVAPNQTVFLALSGADLTNAEIRVTYSTGGNVTLNTSTSSGDGVWTAIFNSDQSFARTYTIYITNKGAAGSVYELTAMLNAMAEVEMLSAPGKGGNDRPANAQDITPVFHGLNPFVSNVTSAAVKGTLSSAGDADWYRFTVADGASFSVMLTDNLPGNISLELYGVGVAASGKSTSQLTEADMVRILAGSVTGQTDAWIDTVKDITDGSPGTYYLKVSRTGTSSGNGGTQLENYFAEYGFLVVQNATFNQEPNDSRETAQPLGDTTHILGYISGTGTTAGLSEQALLSAESARGVREGQAVATTGDIILVGSPGSNRDGESSGAVAIYQFDGTKWYLVGHLEGDDTAYFDQFGATVAISGNTAVVSATGRKNANGTTGAVYVFDYDGASWTQTAMLTSPDNDDGVFGYALDISGNRLIVGSPGTLGAAYVFARDTGATVWRLESTLQNLNATTANSNFGAAVAIYGTTALVGAPSQTVTVGVTEYVKAGMVYVYERATSGSTWTQSATVVAETPSAGALFGYALDMADGLFTAGSPGETVDGKANSGAVYWFMKTAGQWNFHQRMTQGTAAAGDYFGCSLALDGTSLLVGAYGYDNGAAVDAGAAWLFQSVGTTWLQKGKVASQSTAAYDCFGMAVAMKNGTVVVGAPLASTTVIGTDGKQHASPTGVAHVFQDATDVDYYPLTVTSERTITVSLTIPGASASAEFLNMLQYGESLVKLQTSAGVTINATSYSNGYWVFSTGLATNQSVYLVVSAEAGRSGEYILQITGNKAATITALTAPTLSLTPTTPVLQTPPSSFTLTFNQPIRGDLVNLQNISVNTGAGTYHPSGISVSEDGKTVTLLMPTGIPYFNTEPTISILANTFISTGGAVYAPAINTSFRLKINTVSVRTQVTATETGTSVTWTFAEPMNFASLTHDELMAAFQVLNSSGTNLVNSPMTFSWNAAGTTLTWTSLQPLANGTQITTRLDGRLVCATSGAILEGINAQGILTRNFVINMDSHVEAALVVKKTASTVNSTGEASSIPASEKWVDEWQTVWVEVWAYVTSTDNAGLADFDAVIAYDSSLFMPTIKADGTYEFVGSTPFTGTRGQLFVTAGADGTLKISGTTTQTGIGDNGTGSRGQYVMVGRVKFSPSTLGTGTQTGVNLDTVNKKFTAVDCGFRLNGVTGTTTGGVNALSGTVLQRDITGVYPVVYDLNDSGKIDIYDLIQFAKVYGQDPSKSTSPYAWAADFNHDGKINIYDLIQFAKNYGKSRTSGGVSLPDTLTSGWGYTNGVSAGEYAAYQEFAAVLAEESIYFTAEEAELLRSLGMGGLVPANMVLPAEAAEAEEFSPEETAETADVPSAADAPALTAEVTELENAETPQNAFTPEPPAEQPLTETLAGLLTDAMTETLLAPDAKNLAATETETVMTGLHPVSLETETVMAVETAGILASESPELPLKASTIFTPVSVLPQESPANSAPAFTALTTRDAPVIRAALLAPPQSADRSGVTILRFSGNVEAAEIGNVKWMDMNGPPVEVAALLPMTHEKDVHRERLFADEFLTAQNAARENAGGEEDAEDAWMFAVLKR